MANPRRNCPNLAKPSYGPTPAGFAKKNPAFGCRAAPGPAVGRRLARATLRVAVVQLADQLSNHLLKKFGLAPPPEALRAWALRPRDAEHRDWFSPKLGRVLPMAARRLPPRRVRNIRFAHLRPRRRRTEKPLRPTVSVRAPWEIIPDKLTVYRVDFLLRRGARDFSLHFATQTQQSPCGAARHTKAGVGSATS